MTNEEPKKGDRHYREYMQLSAQTDNQLRRSIKSYAKELNLHREKIANPSYHDKGWHMRDNRARAGLLNYWNKEVESLQMKLDWANGILLERGLYNA